MNRRDKKRLVEMPNNSHLVGFKSDRRGNYTIFEATPHSAFGVLDGFKKQLKKEGATSRDKVQMKLVKKLPDGDTGEPGGNRYEIWIDYEFRKTAGLVRIEPNTEAGSMLEELERMQDTQRYALARDITAMAKSLVGAGGEEWLKSLWDVFPVDALSGYRVHHKDAFSRNLILKNRSGDFADVNVYFPSPTNVKIELEFDDGGRYVIGKFSKSDNMNSIVGKIKKNIEKALSDKYKNTFPPEFVRQMEKMGFYEKDRVLVHKNVDMGKWNSTFRRKALSMAKANGVEFDEEYSQEYEELYLEVK